MLTASCIIFIIFKTFRSCIVTVFFFPFLIVEAILTSVLNGHKDRNEQNDGMILGMISVGVCWGVVSMNSVLMLQSSR